MREMQRSLIKYGDGIDLNSKENRKNLKKKIIESPSSADENKNVAPKVYLLYSYSPKNILADQDKVHCNLLIEKSLKIVKQHVETRESIFQIKNDLLLIRNYVLY